MDQTTIYHDVKGSPFKIGDHVLICSATDETTDLSKIGLRGIVIGYEYNTGIGQTYPEDPFIIVVLSDGSTGGFWKEEMEQLFLLSL